MMNDRAVSISCDICCDLMPLVKDGVASVGSAAAVEEHIKDCPSCRELYEFFESAPPVKSDNAFAKVRKEMRIFLAMLLMIGIFFGVSLTGNNGNFFYNVIIMPIIGALGYGVFKKKAFIIIPLLISGCAFLTALIGMMGEKNIHELISMAAMTIYYDPFAVVGTLIAWLIHFALRKDE